ncbi:threonine/serine exporter family protein [Pseudonocardia ailaonensis]|uniref:Threonine/serine exporter family protein n=1 Tax=Pseudonocardia ailaonensis TaxID=367279 RepID=A0ABN2MV18_9PSEU
MVDELNPAERLANRLRATLRRDARKLLSPGPPTLPMLMVGPEVPDDARVQEVLDFCMRVGEVQLSSGESVAVVTDLMLRLAEACGLPAVDVDITFTSITICCHRGNVASPVTSMRLVRYRTLDLTRLGAVDAVVEDLEAGRTDLRRASPRLTEAIERRHPYPRWTATAGWGLLAGAVAVLLGGGAVTAVTAFLVTGAIDRVGRLLSRWGLPAFFLQVVGGLLATTVTIGLFATGVLPPGTRPSLVVAASITVLLSGLSVVGTVQDAISGYYVTSAGRVAEVALLSAGLLVGVVLGLKFGFTVGVALDVAGTVSVSAGRFGLSVVLGAVGAAGYALAGYAPLRSLAVAAMAGAIGWGVYSGLNSYVGIGAIAATGIAAIVVGAGAGLLRRTSQVPSLVVTLAGITPLLPGLTAYRGFYQLAVEGLSEGLATVTLALATGLALAAGVTFGEFVTGPRRRSGSAATVTEGSSQPANPPSGQ